MEPTSRWTPDDGSDGAVVALRPTTVAGCLVLVIAGLLGLHILSQVFRFGFGFEYQMGFHDRVYFGSELNIPTWFSSSVMLLCGLVLLWIARATHLRGGPLVPYWAGLGVIFVVMSMDEAAALHELLSPIFAGTMVSLGETVGGPFVPLGEVGDRYAWVIPGSIATFVLGVIFLRFLFRLPPRTRWLFVASGAVFVTGALGLELIGGRYSGLYGADNVGFVTIMTLEETFEKAGVSLFLYALLRHAEVEFGGIHLRLAPPRASRLHHAA